MTDRVLVAKRINDGQSEIWFQAQPEMRRAVATNGIVYPLRILCTPDESEALYKAFGDGEAVI